MLTGTRQNFDSQPVSNLEPETVESLSLEKCEDLVCKNLMCEKLGEVCVCKLARWSSINGPNLINLKCVWDLADNGDLASCPIRF